MEDVARKRVELQFLDADPEEVILLHPETLEQYVLSRASLERSLPFLKEGSLVQAWLTEDRVVDLDMPKEVVLTVASCGAGLRGCAEHTLKEAALENGLRVMVPQVIEPGDLVLIKVETGAYVERLHRR